MKKSLLTLLLVTLPFGFIARADTEGTSPSVELRQPELTVSTTPEYPLAARKQGIEGTVLVECLVQADGTILAVGTKHQETQPVLASAALEAVREWQFAARNDGKNTPFIVRVPIRFELETPVQAIDTTNIAAR